jgi:hypothetical protein
MNKPTIPTRAADDTINSYGAKVLLFLIANDYSIGLFDLDALEAAHWAAHKAIAQRVNLGTKENPDLSPACVFDRIEVIRRQLTAAITRLAAERDSAVTQLFASVPPQPKDGNKGVLVSDITPKPKLPPALAFASIPMPDDAF